MPIINSQFTVGTAAVQIVAPDVMSQHVCIHNHEHSSNNELFIGNADVTINNGIHAQPTLTSMITIGPGDDLWAVAESDGNQLHVLVVKQD